VLIEEVIEKAKQLNDPIFISEHFEGIVLNTEGKGLSCVASDPQTPTSKPWFLQDFDFGAKSFDANVMI